MEKFQKMVSIQNLDVSRDRIITDITNKVQLSPNQNAFGFPHHSSHEFDRMISNIQTLTNNVRKIPKPKTDLKLNERNYFSYLSRQREYKNYNDYCECCGKRMMTTEYRDIYKLCDDCEAIYSTETKYQHQWKKYIMKNKKIAILNPNFNRTWFDGKTFI